MIIFVDYYSRLKWTGFLQKSNPVEPFMSSIADVATSAALKIGTIRTDKRSESEGRFWKN